MTIYRCAGCGKWLRLFGDRTTHSTLALTGAPASPDPDVHPRARPVDCGPLERYAVVKIGA